MFFERDIIKMKNKCRPSASNKYDDAARFKWEISFNCVDVSFKLIQNKLNEYFQNTIQNQHLPRKNILITSLFIH